MLDQDIASLQFAQKQIRTISLETDIRIDLHCSQLNIRSLVNKNLHDDGFSLIYSAGLFDYFSDPMATHIATTLFESLEKSGQLIIGNFDVSSPSKFFMELAWDWHLIHRSAEDLKRLFSGIGTKISLESEPEKVNLFCGIMK